MSFHLRIKISFLTPATIVGPTFSAGLVLLKHSEYYIKRWVYLQKAAVSQASQMGRHPVSKQRN